MWETLLFNQFHDILPGSSIRRVYDDAERDYLSIYKRASKIISQVKNVFARQQGDVQTVGINTLAIPRRELVSSGPSQASSQGASSFRILEDKAGTGQALLQANTQAPPLGGVTVTCKFPQRSRAPYFRS
jgi:alpha-mannosidase